MKNYLITTSKINGTICLSLWHEKYTDGVRRFMMPRRFPITRRFSTSVSRKKKQQILNVFPIFELSDDQKKIFNPYYLLMTYTNDDSLDIEFNIHEHGRPERQVTGLLGTWESATECISDSGRCEKVIYAMAILYVYGSRSFELKIYDDVSEEDKNKLIKGLEGLHYSKTTLSLFHSRGEVDNIVDCVSYDISKEELKGVTEGVVGVTNSEIEKYKVIKGAWRRGNFKSIFINLRELDYVNKSIFQLEIDVVREALKDRLRKCFIEPNTYTLLGKVKYEYATLMLGKQIGFIVTENHETNEQNLDILVSLIIDRLEALREMYDIPKLLFLQLMYIVNNSYAEFKITDVKKQITNSLSGNPISLNKEVIATKFGIVPVAIDNEQYGPEINGRYNVVTKSFFVDCLKIDKINKLVEIPYNKNLEEAITKPTSYYLLNRNVVSPNILIVIDSEREEEVYIKKLNVYNINGDLVIGNIIDKVIGRIKGYNRDSIDKIRIIRNINTAEFDFVDSKLETKRINYKLPIININSNKYKGSSNPYIGSFDLETYTNDLGEVKVYALGFSNLNMFEQDSEIDKTKLYYLTQDADTSDELVIKCINDMLSSKNRNHIYYVHNLGGYDAAFILKALKKYNLDKGVEYYKTDIIFRNEKILKLTIKVRNSDKSDYSRITFVDSFNILPLSLSQLSKTFDKKYKKGVFPHEFVKDNTLNYIGDTPDKIYFKEKHIVIDDDSYNKLVRDNWSVKEEVLEYLNLDILALLEIMKFFKQYIYTNYNVQITDSLTISRLALNIFLRRYYENDINGIGIVNKPIMYKDIKDSHFGGIAEVYKPKGTNLFYYDVNSLYPFVALNDLPGSNVQYIENVNGFDIGDLFGFFYCVVETGKDHYFGLLPARDKGLISPIGKWEGWYFSEEIKFAVKNGYKVTVIKGYIFDKIKNVFRDYVDSLYRKKSAAKGGIKVITKLLLNSLLGRFGMGINKPTTKLVNEKKYLEIASTKEVKGFPIILDDNSYIVTYMDEISHSVCKGHGLDYIKILNDYSKIDAERYNQFTDVSISICAAITSYARIFMNNLKLDLMKQGYKIWYMDTDSLVVDKPLDSSLVGSELGQFKLEYIIKEAYFITAKTYCLVLEDNTVIIKAKGVFDHSLTLEKFKLLYLSNTVTAKKSDSKVDLVKGYTTIGEKEVKLSGKSYTKRNKVYDKKGLWIDTKALIRCDEKYISNSTEYTLVDYYLNSLSEIYKSIYPKINLKYLLSAPVYLPIIPSMLDYEEESGSINNTGSLEIIPRWYRFSDWYTPIVIQVPAEEVYDQLVSGNLNVICSQLIDKSFINNILNTPSEINDSTYEGNNNVNTVSITLPPKNKNKRSIIVKVFDIENNRYTYYNSIRSAGTALNINESIIRRRLKDKSIKPYFNKFIFYNDKGE